MLITNIKNTLFVLAVFALLMGLGLSMMLIIKAGNDRMNECTAKGGVIVYGGQCVKGV